MCPDHWDCPSRYIGSSRPGTHIWCAKETRSSLVHIMACIDEIFRIWKKKELARLFHAWLDCFALLRRGARGFVLSECFMFNLVAIQIYWKLVKAWVLQLRFATNNHNSRFVLLRVKKYYKYIYIYLYIYTYIFMNICIYIDSCSKQQFV